MDTDVSSPMPVESALQLRDSHNRLVKDLGDLRRRAQDKERRISELEAQLKRRSMPHESDSEAVKELKARVTAVQVCTPYTIVVTVSSGPKMFLLD